MRIFNRIIQDSKAPNTFDLWINKGRLKYFNGGWKDLGGSEQVSWNDIQGKPNLSAVATSGSYNDLSDKPTIPPAYSLPIANANTLGGVKSATTGTTSGRDYNVEIKADGTMKVNVPWVDLNTTYAKATGTTLGLVMIGYTENGKNYPVELDKNGKMFVNVPWTNTTYSVATQSANGLMSSSDKAKLDNLIKIPTTLPTALPNASASVRGGVLMAASITDLAGTEDTTAICTKINALLAALRTAGILNQ